MSAWTDIRNAAEEKLGIRTPQQVAGKIGSELANVVKLGTTTVQQAVRTPAASIADGAGPNEGFFDNVSRVSVAGISLPLIIAIGLGALIIMRGRK